LRIGYYVARSAFVLLKRRAPLRLVGRLFSGLFFSPKVDRVEPDAVAIRTAKGAGQAGGQIPAAEVATHSSTAHPLAPIAAKQNRIPDQGELVSPLD
jgi:hypothetical protein